jgi:hypothetical protein
MGLVYRKYVGSRCLFVEWKMTKRKKGDDHDKMKGKTLG